MLKKERKEERNGFRERLKERSEPKKSVFLLLKKGQSEKKRKQKEMQQLNKPSLMQEKMLMRKKVMQMIKLRKKEMQIELSEEVPEAEEDMTKRKKWCTRKKEMEHHNQKVRLMQSRVEQRL
jgi:hypothetical protein